MSWKTSTNRKMLRWCGGLWLALSCAALTWVCGGDSESLLRMHRGAAADEFDAFVESTTADQGEDGSALTVRMNFFNATWPGILRRVAEETGSELVMKKAPAGRWTRVDRKRYSRTDAVRLLNQELETKGFRLLEQGRFLVVLHLDSLRTRYQRPTVPGSRPLPTQPVQQVAGSGGPAPIQSADFAVERRQPRLAPVVVPTRKRGAKEVALLIYTALKDRAELTNDGPGSLPAFQVFSSQRSSERSSAPDTGSVRDTSPRAESAVQFAVGIDTERDELVVVGSRDQQQHVARMIRSIDSAETGPGRGVRLVASRRDVRKMSQALRPALQMMLAQRQPGNEQPEPNPAVNNQPLQRPDAPGAAGEQPLVRIEGLRGPVTIQEVPGVGMVVTGNQNDVDAVVRLMRRLEELARGAVPGVELLRLRHVNSAALADLLSTVYEQLTDIRGGGQRSQAAIIPVVKPNAVLVIASPAELESIAGLAERLDEPVDPRSEFQVFALKHAPAVQVVETLNALYAEGQTGQQGQQGQQQQENAAGLAVRMRAVADVRTNSVIVQAAPRDLVEVALLIRKIDRDTAASVNRMKVFPLKNAVADELAEVINSSIQSVLNPARTTGGAGGGGQFAGAGGGGQAAQQLQDARSVVIEFLTADGTARQIIRSGILADIRVTADTRVNSLIVTAPEQSMALMAELIRQLDRPTSNVAEIKVFTLTNSDAAGMAELLETLFASEDNQNQLGVQVAGAEDASSGLIPLRFSVDTRTNSVIAIGGAEALRVVEAILLRLDETDIRQRKTIVVKLKNSPAQAVADAINLFLQSQRELAQIDPELVSNVELLEREIIVEPELVSNSLLVSATPRYYEEVLRIIKELDEAPAQVIIQTLIVEVLLDNTDELGVQLGFQDSLLFDRGLLNPDNFQTITQTISDPSTGIQTTTEQIVNQETLPGFLFNNQQLGNNTLVRPGSVGSQGLSDFSLGRVNGDLGFGGLVLSASSESVSVLVRALASQRNVHVLSRPQIRTVDNQLASIQVGQQVPVVAGATTNALGGVTPTLGQPQLVGISLQVTPRITPDDVIVMETIANKSQIAGQGVPFLSDPTTGAVIESPIFDFTEARATISVPDGQTVVLGGMITQSDDTLERKVPWLGDIPILGTAFRYDSTVSRRTELLIFMTPRIIRGAADSELIKQVESERLHYLEEVAEEVHGPLFAVPPEMAPLTPPGGFPGAFPVPGGGYIPPGCPPDGGDVPTTIMPQGPSEPISPPPLPGPGAALEPNRGGSAMAGRQTVRAAAEETVRGSKPQRRRWLPRWFFGSK